MNPKITISDDRLERAEDLVRAIHADSRVAIRFGLNPPVDKRIIDMLKVVGIGWQPMRWVFLDRDVTDDLHVLFDQLSPLTINPEAKFDRAAVRVVGERMNAIGGFDVMLKAHGVVQQMAGQGASQINHVWDGIGDWRS